MRITKLFFIVLLVISILPMFILLSCAGPTSEIERRVPETTPIKSNPPVERFTDTFELILEKTNKGTINALEFSPNGKQLAVASLEGLWIYDTGGGTDPSVLIGHEGEVLALAWSDDKTLASGGEDKTVRLWDAKTRKLLKTLERHTGRVNALAFSPDGKTLASGSRYKADYFSKLPDKPMKSPFEEPMKSPSNLDELTEYLDELDKKHKEYIEEMRKRLDQRLGLSNSGNFDNTICLWNTGTSELQYTLKSWTAALAFMDNKTLASSFSRNEAGRLKLWDVGTGSPKPIRVSIQKSPNIINISAGSIYIGPDDDNSLVNIAPGGSYNGKFYEHGASFYPEITAVVFLPHGPAVAEARARVIDVSFVGRTYKNVKFKISGWPGYIEVESLITTMAFSPSGNYLAAGGPEEAIQLWSVKTKKLLHTFEAHTVGVTALALSKNGMLASGNQDGTIFLWEFK